MKINWPVKIDAMLAAMSRAAHLARDSNADLMPRYRRDIDLIQATRADILNALHRERQWSIMFTAFSIVLLAGLVAAILTRS